MISLGIWLRKEEETADETGFHEEQDGYLKGWG